VYKLKHTNMYKYIINFSLQLKISLVIRIKVQFLLSGHSKKTGFSYNVQTWNSCSKTVRTFLHIYIYTKCKDDSIISFLPACFRLIQ
jgi:hypothetical protein